jgi:hypothetical protein
MCNSAAVISRSTTPDGACRRASARPCNSLSRCALPTQLAGQLPATVYLIAALAVAGGLLVTATAALLPAQACAASPLPTYSPRNKHRRGPVHLMLLVR